MTNDTLYNNLYKTDDNADTLISIKSQCTKGSKNTITYLVSEYQQSFGTMEDIESQLQSNDVESEITKRLQNILDKDFENDQNINNVDNLSNVETVEIGKSATFLKSVSSDSDSASRENFNEQNKTRNENLEVNKTDTFEEITEDESEVKSPSQIEAIEIEKKAKVLEALFVNDTKLRKKQKFKPRAFIDSDLEDYSLQNEDEDENENNTEITKKKIFKIIDSDSEVEDNSKDDVNTNNTMQRLKALVDSDSEEETPETSGNLKNKKSILETLNSDNNVDLIMNEHSDNEHSAINRDDEDEFSTKVSNVKEAMEQRRVIQSEKQRMVREARVSLPYHRPKSHTLQEFLTRRTRFSDIFIPPPNVPIAIALKMSPEKFQLTEERLKQRQKEIEDFYKSDSDSDSEKIEEKETNLEKSSENNGKIDANLENNDKSNSSTENNVECASEKMITYKTDTVITEITDGPSVSENNKASTSGDDSGNVDTVQNKRLSSLLMSSFKPRLSGGPDEIIELDRDLRKSKEITQLKKRFFMSTSAENPTLKKGFSILTDKVPDQVSILHKPGAKLKLLKEELEEQMYKKQKERWEQRQKEKDAENQNTELAEKSECGGVDELLDNDEEEELTASESSDSEPEMMDVPEKPRTKSAFIDDEAEESENDADAEDDNEEDEDVEIIVNKDISESQTEKHMRRIIKSFDNDSDDSDQEDVVKDIEQKLKDNNFDKNLSWDDDDCIPANQPRNNKTPCKPMTQPSQDMSFLTPTMQLSALQGMSSTSKELLQDSPALILNLPPEPSPLKSQQHVKTKLFMDNDNNDEVIDFDELENLCSGRFTGTAVAKSAENDLTQSNVPKNLKNTPCSVNMRLVLSSSDEDDEKDDAAKKKKSRKKVNISDDESTNEADDADEDGDGADGVENSDMEEEFDRDLANVDYDSEENEIDASAQETAQVNLKARDFFDVEAELSESEWGSADEDERDLDQMEKEEGDEEQFNQKKVQQELGRMHMRQVLDEDKREVRLLQELLLEDGEMHGAGREKKFRWKNADVNTWNEATGPKDDDCEDEEMESELQWRKMRHEREKFLEEQRNKDNTNYLETIANDSQFLKMGRVALVRGMSDSQQSDSPPPTPSPSGCEAAAQSFMVWNKRGSVLARGENTLTRLAEVSKISTAGVKGLKNTKNFVFTSVMKTLEEDTEIQVKKRKAVETPKAIKKLKLADKSGKAKRLKM